MLWIIPLIIIFMIIYWKSKRQENHGHSKKVIEGDIKRKKSCVNCKHLVKSVETEDGVKEIVVDSTGRQKILSMDYSFISNSSVPWKLGCSQGVWKEKGVGYTEEKLNEVLMEINRDGKCNFENYIG